MTRSLARKPLSDRRQREAFLDLARTLIHHERGGLEEIDLLEEISRMLRDLFHCAAVQVWFGQEPNCFRFGVGRRERGGFLPSPVESCRLARICRSVQSGSLDPSLGGYAKNGSLWIEDLWKVPLHPAEPGTEAQMLGDSLDHSWRSLAIIPFGDDQEGALILAGPQPAWFKSEEVPFLVDIARTIGAGIALQRRQDALGERVKELTCLYGLSTLAQRRELPLSELLQEVAELIPPAWRYPEFAHCRITFSGEVFESREFEESRLRQGANIFVKGEHQGGIDVFYSEEVPRGDEESPFLPEERNLIEGLAREVSLMIERRQLDKDREGLWEQLRHMDRLATIGQLTANVAHELNEPLCGILGLAQLAIKDQELPPQAKRDIKKIIASSLQARDVVRGLLGFSRSAPVRKVSVALNRIVEDAIDLFKARCARAKVTIHRELDPDLPKMSADPSQIHQVLVNLIVNAIQSMPNGGRLTLGTCLHGEKIQLSVEDSGIGMNDDTLRQIFVPFFTTKEVGLGTGLGMCIVHSIVTSHGGTIAVKSRSGEGSSFTIEFQREDPEGILERFHE